MNMKWNRTFKVTSINRWDITGDNHKDIRFIDAITVISTNKMRIKASYSIKLLIAGTNNSAAISLEWRSSKNENTTDGYLYIDC